MVPLAWAKIYGDDSLLVQGYDAILRWFDYMDAHSEKGLVVREEEGGWCLGDWCFPASEEKEQLPEAFIQYVLLLAWIAGNDANFRKNE